MNDSLKMFLIALVTSVATQVFLGPYIERVQVLMTGEKHEPVRAEADELAPDSVTTAVAAPEKLSAPNLEGMTVEAARDRFRERGLVIVEEGERRNVAAEPNTIIQQRPAPGAVLTEKEIRVIVAQAPETTQVPDVLGQPLEEARASLVGAGFEVPEPTRRAVEGKKPGTVVEQAPNPGAALAAGAAVRLTVAEATLHAVPALEGTSLSAAKAALEGAGLELGRVRRREHPELRGGQVLSQSPEANAEVAAGTKVDLIVVAPD